MGRNMSNGFAIEAQNLKKSFGDLQAVKGVNFHAEKGEILSLLGPNGAGKTTAIRMLCGTLPPTSGEIRVAGVDMVESAREARSIFRQTGMPPRWRTITKSS